jgi:hypothetical protein
VAQPGFVPSQQDGKSRSCRGDNRRLPQVICDEEEHSVLRWKFYAIDNEKRTIVLLGDKLEPKPGWSMPVADLFPRHTRTIRSRLEHRKSRQTPESRRAAADVPRQSSVGGSM